MIQRAVTRALAVAWLVTTVTFVALAVGPGDPARVIAGPRATPQVLAAIRARHCLEGSIVRRYGCHMAATARGDFGISYRHQRPTRAVIAERASVTAQLLIAAMVVHAFLGIGLGVLAAATRRPWLDRAVRGGLLAVQAVPSYALGFAALFLFAFQLAWFPIGGAGPATVERLPYLVLPAVTLALAYVAPTALIVRQLVQDSLRADHVRLARAKGLPEWRVLVHAVAPVRGPCAAAVAHDLAGMIAGSLVVEVVFGWPGLGQTLAQALRDLDLPLATGVVTTLAVAVAFVNGLADGIGRRTTEPPASATALGPRSGVVDSR